MGGVHTPVALAGLACPLASFGCALVVRVDEDNKPLSQVVFHLQEEGQHISAPSPFACAPALGAGCDSSLTGFLRAWGLTFGLRPESCFSTPCSAGGKRKRCAAVGASLSCSRVVLELLSRDFREGGCHLLPLPPCAVLLAQEECKRERSAAPLSICASPPPPPEVTCHVRPPGSISGCSREGWGLTPPPYCLDPMPQPPKPQGQGRGGVAAVRPSFGGNWPSLQVVGMERPCRLQKPPAFPRSAGFSRLPQPPAQCFYRHGNPSVARARTRCTRCSLLGKGNHNHPPPTQNSGSLPTAGAMEGVPCCRGSESDHKGSAAQGTVHKAATGAHSGHRAFPCTGRKKVLLRHTTGSARHRSWHMGGPAARLPDPGRLPSRSNTKGWCLVSGV